MKDGTHVHFEWFCICSTSARTMWTTSPQSPATTAVAHITILQSMDVTIFYGKYSAHQSLCGAHNWPISSLHLSPSLSQSATSEQYSLVCHLALRSLERKRNPYMYVFIYAILNLIRMWNVETCIEMEAIDLYMQSHYINLPHGQIVTKRIIACPIWSTQNKINANEIRTQLIFSNFPKCS